MTEQQPVIGPSRRTAIVPNRIMVVSATYDGESTTAVFGGALWGEGEAHSPDELDTKHSWYVEACRAALHAREFGNGDQSAATE